MRFSAAAVTACTVAGTTLLCGNVASGFAPSRTFVSRSVNHVATAVERVHAPSCACPACTGVHQPSCACSSCARVGRTLLFADTVSEDPLVDALDADVPAEVEAMDGIDSPDEAHNAERPARASLQKKQKKGKPLSELAPGDIIMAKVKTITNYGAFMDIGAETDGLLHISRLSAEFVKDVNEVLKPGQELEVRIVSIDASKNQVALTALTEEEEAAGERPQRSERRQQSSRRDDGAILKSLQEKGWDTEKFVEGTVASTVAFGAFVRVDVSQWNSETEGEIDGLVHISALAPRRVEQVTSVVNVGDKVQVRCKGIDGGKVSLSMIAKEDERPSGGRGGPGGPPPVEGNKDWRESLEKMQETMPKFHNGPVVVDSRK